MNPASSIQSHYVLCAVCALAEHVRRLRELTKRLPLNFPQQVFTYYYRGSGSGRPVSRIFTFIRAMDCGIARTLAILRPF